MNEKKKEKKTKITTQATLVDVSARSYHNDTVCMCVCVCAK